MEKSIDFQNRKPYLVALIILYTLFCLAQLGIFVYMVNSGLRHCKELIEIVLDAIMLLLGAGAFYVMYRN